MMTKKKVYRIPETLVCHTNLSGIITTSNNSNDNDIPKGGETDEFDAKRRNFYEPLPSF